MKNLLGGKGANLAEMTNLGIPVPAGFTITTEVCNYYFQNRRKVPTGLQEDVFGAGLTQLGHPLGEASSETMPTRECRSNSLKEPATPIVAPRWPVRARRLTSASVFVHTVPMPTPANMHTTTNGTSRTKGTRMMLMPARRDRCEIPFQIERLTSCNPLSSRR
jgi:hypothetical protein